MTSPSASISIGRFAFFIVRFDKPNVFNESHSSDLLAMGLFFPHVYTWKRKSNKPVTWMLATERILLA
jgi:hypothetical protein